MTERKAVGSIPRVTVSVRIATPNDLAQIMRCAVRWFSNLI